MKNTYCKTENGYELIGYGGKPVNVTHKIEEENCECLNDKVLINPQAKLLNKVQLEELRKELPIWAEKNISKFTEEDLSNLKRELNVSDQELLKKFKYKFSYFGKPTAAEIPVYTIRIKSNTFYVPNYIDEYSFYGRKDNYGFEVFPLQHKPTYPIIEDEDWAINELGIK